MKFDGSSGRKPETEARKYVYNILVEMLRHELSPEEKDGWMFGGIERDADQQLLRKAIKGVMSEMKRRGQ